MEKIKVLLTECAGADSAELSDVLSAMGMNVKGCTRNGAELLKLVTEFKPDVIIMDVFMQHIDGMGVMERLNSMNPVNRPLITVVSCVDNPKLQRMFLREGVDYYFLKPIDVSIIAERIIQMISWSGVGVFSNYSSPQDLDFAVSQTLHKFGMPAKIKGYRYIRDAVLLVIERPGVINNVTTIIYPHIAKKYNSDPSSVERAMRYAVKVAWESGNERMFKHYFGYMAEAFTKPSNSEFIARISDDLRHKWKMNKLYDELDFAENN